MFEPPVRAADGGGIALALPADERSLLVRLLGELGALLERPGDDDVMRPDVAARLNPSVYEDRTREEEYQRLMSDELLASRLGAIETVKAALAHESPQLDESGANAFMRAVNTIRLVLGTMLGITDDEEDDGEDDEDDEQLDERPEYQLYTWLSWLLEWTVRSL